MREKGLDRTRRPKPVKAQPTSIEDRHHSGSVHCLKVDRRGGSDPILGTRPSNSLTGRLVRAALRSRGESADAAMNDSSKREAAGQPMSASVLSISSNRMASALDAPASPLAANP